MTAVPNYCEENVWQLARLPSQNPRWAVFVSNAERACRMSAQRSTITPGEPVIWDYHVILLEKGETGFQVWDADCTEGSPLNAMAWTQATFPEHDVSVRFRLIPAEEFIQNFRSDRRHMRTADGNLESPPPWPPISENESNLDEYSHVECPTPGFLLNLESWKEFQTP